MKVQTGSSVFVLAATFASPAFAHTGHGDVAGFVAGIAHPVLGQDHLMAMVTVGLWAGLVGGRALLAWPLAFIGSMLAGGALGMGGMMLPGVELVIGVSVVALGAAVAAGVKPQLVLGAGLIALFGLAHGHAHGMEAPASGSGAYVVGFVLATAALHGIGLALVKATRARYAPAIARHLGALAALAGVALAVS
jgi:urease accessory protein